jgi:hypothetical protein
VALALQLFAANPSTGSAGNVAGSINRVVVIDQKRGIGKLRPEVLNNLPNAASSL